MSPPVKLELFTEDEINKQLAKTREQHPWSDTTLVLEMAKPKPKKKGRGRGQGKAKPRKDLQQDTPSQDQNFDPGIELLLNFHFRIVRRIVSRIVCRIVRQAGNMQRFTKNLYKL